MTGWKKRLVWSDSRCRYLFSKLTVTSYSPFLHIGIIQLHIKKYSLSLTGGFAIRCCTTVLIQLKPTERQPAKRRPTISSNIAPHDDSRTFTYRPKIVVTPNYMTSPYPAS